MEQEEIVKNIEELNNNYESLEALFDVFKSGIEKQIDWFYAVLAIMIAILLIALFFLVKSMVQTGIEKGIKQATSTVQTEITRLESQITELKTSQEETILKVLKENPQIKWATGTSSSYGIEMHGADGILKLRSFVGEINWQSPINHFEIKIRNEISVDYKIIERYVDGMDVLIYNAPNDAVYEWKFIWVTK